MAGATHRLMTPLEQRAFKMTGTVAAGVGAVSTAVVLMAAAPTASNPATSWPIATWCIVTNDANLGTTIKFIRKGLYQARMTVPLTPAVAIASHVAVSLDPAAVNFIAATAVMTSPTMEDNARALELAAYQATSKLSAEIYIPDALASTSAVAANGTLAGTVRFHATSGAGAAIDAGAWIDAEVAVHVQALNESFG